MPNDALLLQALATILEGLTHVSIDSADLPRAEAVSSELIDGSSSVPS